MIKNLKNLGLSDNEAKVYLSMLELGPSSVLEISAKAGVNRPTTYVQIETLKKMGLASTQTKGKKQLFQAESPDNFSHLFQREEVTLKEKREELAQLLPDLRSLFTNSGGRAKIRFIEGIEGVSRIQEEFLQSGEKMVYGMSSLDDLFRVFPKQTESFSPRRIEKRIHLKFIYTSSQGPILQNANDSLLTESKYIPADKLPFHLDMAVYGDNVALASLRGNVSGVFIEHREIAESLKNLFEFFWNSL